MEQFSKRVPFAACITAGRSSWNARKDRIMNVIVESLTSPKLFALT